MGRLSDVCLRASTHPEFDAWRWSNYWVPLEAVIEFKRQVYQLALIELARILFRSRSFELPDSYRLPEPEPAPEAVRGYSVRACRARIARCDAEVGRSLPPGCRGSGRCHPGPAAHDRVRRAGAVSAPGFGCAYARLFQIRSGSAPLNPFLAPCLRAGVAALVALAVPASAGLLLDADPDWKEGR